MASLRNLALALGALLPAAVSAAPTPAASIQTIPGRYIITLKNGIDALDLDNHFSWLNDLGKRNLDGRGDILSGARKIFSFDAFNAYVGEFDETLIELLKLSKDVRPSMPSVPRQAQVHPLACAVKEDKNVTFQKLMGMNLLRRFSASRRNRSSVWATTQLPRGCTSAS